MVKTPAGDCPKQLPGLDILDKWLLIVRGSCKQRLDCIESHLLIKLERWLRFIGLNGCL